MDRNDVVRLAAAFAEREGCDVARYRAHAELSGDAWMVRFRPVDEAKPRPGDFFVVHVDDRTGSVLRIVHGK